MVRIADGITSSLSEGSLQPFMGDSQTSTELSTHQTDRKLYWRPVDIRIYFSCSCSCGSKQIDYLVYLFPQQLKLKWTIYKLASKQVHLHANSLT